MNRLLGALTGVVALLAAFPVAHAETPDSTLVMAMNIDDIISLDPAETFELVGGEVIANVYDRITVYEPGAVVELTGGVAELGRRGRWPHHRRTCPVRPSIPAIR